MNYVVSVQIPKDLSQSEIERCISLVCDGGAIDKDKARRNIPRACVLVIARSGKTIVGFGAIKRLMRRHTLDVAKLAGYDLDARIPEIGYVVVDPEHRRRGLSGQILNALTRQHPGVLFATTDDHAMKKTLASGHFIRQGREWDGNRGKLSLWVRSREA